MRQVFYDETTKQVEAVYRGCRGSRPGFVEIEFPDDVKVNRDYKIIDGEPVFFERPENIAAKEADEAEEIALAVIRASTYVTDWDANISGKTFAEIKTLYDGTTQAQKSDLLFYLLLVRALEVKG